MPPRVAAFLWAALPVLAQPVRVALDPRVELLSILFHLAGNPEYNQCRVTAYCDSVDKYFAPIKDHEAIRIARELSEKSDISYDAVMSMAIHVKDADTLAERIPFDAPDSRLESGGASGSTPVPRGPPSVRGTLPLPAVP